MAQKFWQLQELSDQQLLCGLAELQQQGRRATAELVAHLAEVDRRRLHLHAACGSLFEYCVARLGLSEDEACRRIEAARLGQRFPALFPLLASGEVSLSVAALLKPYLREDNHRELLLVVAGRSVRQARERLAARFPRPDVPSSVRKLPVGARRGTAAIAAGKLDHSSGSGASGGETGAGSPSASVDPPSVVAPNAAVSSALVPSALVPSALVPSAVVETVVVPNVVDRFELQAPAAGARMRDKARIEALSAERYRVQFTAGLALKQKLELARDLMRHQNPSGDLAPIVEQALELLLERIMKRRFGRGASVSNSVSATAPSVGTQPAATGAPVASTPATTVASQAAATPAAADRRATLSPEAAAGATGQPAASPAMPMRIGNATRRTVSERDGVCCTWVDDNGKRCASQAWLEFDHCVPRGKGGGSEEENIRLLCRAHNQLCAELHYGRSHIERAMGARKSKPTVPLAVRDVSSGASFP